MTTWLVQHLTALRDALRRLLGAPLNTLLSLLVIGVALTLPTAGWLAIENLRAVTGDTPGVQQISIFLALEAGPPDVAKIESLLQQASPGSWHYVPRDQALKRLRESAGMAEIIGSLPKNPLPDAFVVTPADAQPESLELLAKTFASWPKVAHVQLDSAWVKRLDALLRLGKLIVVLLAVLFSGALVAITFNTIRLQILAQAAEIEVAKLIGATNSYIQRPLHYFGMLQGALGGLCAAALVSTGSHLLTPPVAELARLYGGSFTLQGLASNDIVALTAIGGGLGWLGAKISALIHLRRIS
ncbi:permease-like cell division protein FtsX [Candidatus Accumulibacter sp. ACC007]|uniref:permease-like cell division protein FtsX n=1 Tax=Candidatus Accumulibacter sp. ACC007 TaxID=2823333 RepID=UPI0025C25945|nr:permease-like cell division protein FtsX [Candidatus Accumulibacter sp. ACC007]